ncbi:unnamed protein product, partial [Onchocerca flexuosa]|uniref:DUF4604 domain-containing protein n=1 Tax=Onchocerca flexuosa TaxID=387005 RepID=A0A183HQ62_9BILA
KISSPNCKSNRLFSPTNVREVNSAAKPIAGSIYLVFPEFLCLGVGLSLVSCSKVEPPFSQRLGQCDTERGAGDGVQMMDDFEELPGNKPLRLPKKAAKVKNKAPAALQITAEQLLREAKERDLEIVAPPPKTKISDPEELAEYQRKRRYVLIKFSNYIFHSEFLNSGIRK